MHSKAAYHEKKTDRIKTDGITRYSYWESIKFSGGKHSGEREIRRQPPLYSPANLERAGSNGYHNQEFNSGGVIQRQPIFGDNFGYRYRDITSQQMLTGTANINQNRSNANGFQLGWGSIAGFTSNAAGTMFTFTHGHRFGGGPMPAGVQPIPALPGAPLPPPPAGAVHPAGSQIVTRGVSSCSVIMVTIGNRHAMAHLDAHHIIGDNFQTSMDMMANLVPIPPPAPVFPEIFVSIHNNNPNRPAFFSRRLIEHYYPQAPQQPGPPPAGAPLIPYLTLGLPAGHRVRVLNRSVPGGNDMFTHPEIGMSTDAVHGRQVFGVVRGNDLLSPDGHISTSDSRFTESITAPQASFDALHQTGTDRQHSAANWADLYRFFHRV